MPCLKLPIPSIPQLPAPLSLTPPAPPIPPLPGLPNLCCKLPPVQIPLPPIPIPSIILNPAILAVLREAIDTVNSYIHSLPLECPLE